MTKRLCSASNGGTSPKVASGVPINPAVIQDVLGEGEGRAREAGQDDPAESANPLVAHQDR